MRYFLLGLVLLLLVVVSIAGCRGQYSRRPPIELIADMDRQPKLRPQAVSRLFADGLTSSKPVPGTVARGSPYAEVPFNTGVIPGTTNFVELLPTPVTAQLLARGQERYGIHCAMCHGAAGDSKGILAKYQMVGMANFHEKRLVTMTDGEIFNTITRGKNNMAAYGPNLDIADRWAIIASRSATSPTWKSASCRRGSPAWKSLHRTSWGSGCACRRSSRLPGRRVSTWT